MQEPQTFQPSDHPARKLLAGGWSHAGLASVICLVALAFPYLNSAGKVPDTWLQGSLFAMCAGWILCLFPLSRKLVLDSGSACCNGLRFTTTSLFLGMPASWLTYQIIQFLLYLLNGIAAVTADVFPSAMPFVQSSIDILNLGEVGMSIAVPLFVSIAWHLRLVEKAINQRDTAVCLATAMAVALVAPAAWALFHNGHYSAVLDKSSYCAAFLAIASGMAIAFGTLAYLGRVLDRTTSETEGSPTS